MIQNFDFDFKNPDYSAVFEIRQRIYLELRDDPKKLAAFKKHYSQPENFVDYINDWGMTFDPRNLDIGLPAEIPFITFPKQDEFVRWLISRWRSRERGFCEKSRDMGVSWLFAEISACFWRFVPDILVGCTTYKEDKLDKAGDMDSMFEKVRFCISRTPDIFMPPGFNEREHFNFCRITHPQNEMSITGEVGTDVGRGGRRAIYLVDEADSLQNQSLAENALSQTTNTRIDASTFKGSGSIFYKHARKKFVGTEKVFIFDWRDDPRKSQAWYDKQCRELDSVTVAQEIDRNPEASAEGVFIPAHYINAIKDAHKKIEGWPKSKNFTLISYDPADVGDARAIVYREDRVIRAAKQKTKGDVVDATRWLKRCIEQLKPKGLTFEADGLGATNFKLGLKDWLSSQEIGLFMFYASGPVKDKDQLFSEGLGAETRGDRILNRRADAWYNFYILAENTYNCIEKGVYHPFEDMISLDMTCEDAEELAIELSRPLRVVGPRGKLAVEKKEDMKKRGVDSTNLADAAVENVYTERTDLEYFRDEEYYDDEDLTDGTGRLF